MSESLDMKIVGAIIGQNMSKANKKPLQAAEDLLICTGSIDLVDSNLGVKARRRRQKLLARCMHAASLLPLIRAIQHGLDGSNVHSSL